MAPMRCGISQDAALRRALEFAWTGLLLRPRSAGTDANFPHRALDRKNHSLGDSDGGKDYVRAFSAKQRLEPHLDFTFEAARFGTGSDTNTGCAWLNEFIPKLAGIAVPFTETATVCGVLLAYCIGPNSSRFISRWFPRDPLCPPWLKPLTSSPDTTDHADRGRKLNDHYFPLHKKHALPALAHQSRKL
jgi:hypothetical protein